MATFFLPDGSRIDYSTWKTFSRTEMGGIAFRDAEQNWRGDIMPNGTIILPDWANFQHYAAPIADINKAMDFVLQHAKDSNASSYKLADIKRLLDGFDAKRKEWKK